MIRTLLVGALIGYLAIAAVLYLFQRRLQYFPDTQRISPAAAGLAGFDEISLATPDGETLLAWHAPAPSGKRTIVYFHGNGGALQHRADRARLFRRSGYGMLLLSYRGYGGSTGVPTEKGLAIDALTAIDHLAGLGVDPSDLIYFGESIGAGVAVPAAVARPPAGVVLEAPFTSALDVAKGVYWWLPVGLLMKDRFESDALIGRVHAPLAIIHGDRDTVVPIGLGHRLYEAANEPKIMIVQEGRGHNTPLDPEVWRRIESFLASSRPQTD